jgi:uncharacterized protein (DUF2252 family)
VTKIAHPSVEERRAQGKAGRERAAPGCHAGWTPQADRPDPVALLEAQNTTREPDLVPVRRGRMMVSPFTFYRGGAKIMAADLDATPNAGLTTQLCGDAHLSNFGVYASPERTLLFDLNDFDETLPGPFEWDVKRMAASFTIAARNNGFTQPETRAATLRSAQSYRERMAEFAQMTTMDIWYARLSEQDLMRAIDTAAHTLKGTGKALAKTAEKKAQRTADKARTHDSLQALSKLAELVDGRYRIVSQPPLIIPVREMAADRGLAPDEVEHMLRELFRRYRGTLQDDRRQLLERFQLVDVARKVVGVGSVGTRCFIALLQGRDEQDPPKSRYRQPGERVVQGQRLMQAASDIYLGWTKGVEDDRFLYWRQLRDMKGSVVVEDLTASGLEFYAHICGQTLARAHARSGDPIAIASYLGKKDRFDQSIADFAERYADQNERDYEAFCAAIRSGRLEAHEAL